MQKENKNKKKKVDKSLFTRLPFRIVVDILNKWYVRYVPGRSSILYFYGYFKNDKSRHIWNMFRSLIYNHCYLNLIPNEFEFIGFGSNYYHNRVNRLCLNINRLKVKKIILSAWPICDKTLTVIDSFRKNSCFEFLRLQRCYLDIKDLQKCEDMFNYDNKFLYDRSKTKERGFHDDPCLIIKNEHKQEFDMERKNYNSLVIMYSCTFNNSVDIWATISKNKC